MKSKHPSIFVFALALGISPFALGAVASAQETQQPQMPEAGVEAGTETETTGAIGSVDITAEQQTELRTVIQEGDAQPIESVDFDLAVGTAVPESVTLHTLPPRVVEIVPAYEEYKYFVLADGRIVIVNPGDMQIVAVITS